MCEFNLCHNRAYTKNLIGYYIDYMHAINVGDKLKIYSEKGQWLRD